MHGINTQASGVFPFFCQELEFSSSPVFRQNQSCLFLKKESVSTLVLDTLVPRLKKSSVVPWIILCFRASPTFLSSQNRNYLLAVL